MRPIELAPVKHCLRALRSPGTDRGDMAHTHRLANTRSTNTEKCWHPTAILSLGPITGLRVTKPKMTKRGHTVVCLGWWIGWLTLAPGPDCGNSLTVSHNACDEFHSVCWDLYRVIKQRKTETHSFIICLQQSSMNSIASFFLKTSLTLNTYLDSSLLLSTGVHGGWGGINHTTVHTNCEALI